MRSCPSCKNPLPHLCLILLAESCPCYSRASAKVEMYLLHKAGTCHNYPLSLNSSTYSPPSELCHGAEEFPSLGSIPQLFSLLQPCCHRSRAQSEAGTGMAARSQQSTVWAAASVMVGVEMREFCYYSPKVGIFFTNLSRDDFN